MFGLTRYYRMINPISHAPRRSTAFIPAVRGFDLEAYGGLWYEIARLPFYFEKNMDFVTARYTLNEKGTLNIVNSGIREGVYTESKGVGRLKVTPDIAELEVSFFRPFYFPYRIIELNDDYSCAVVCTSTLDHVWILSRSPSLSAERLRTHLQRLHRWGFAVEHLEFPRQQPANVSR